MNPNSLSIAFAASTFALASAAGCAVAEADDGPLATSESAQTSFDPNWLADGTPTNSDQLASWFHPGGRALVLGRSTVSVRVRHCNRATGCDAWEPEDAAPWARGGRVDALVSNGGQARIRIHASGGYDLRCESHGQLFCDPSSETPGWQPQAFGQLLRFRGRLTTTGLWARAVARTTGSGTWTEAEVVLTSRFRNLPNERDWVIDDSDRAVLRVRTPSTYDDAVATCRSVGGHVARHDDALLFVHTGVSGQTIWAGARRSADGTFASDDGRPFPMTGFIAGEPNYGAQEDCLEWIPGYGLNDHQCSQQRAYGCVVTE